MYRNIHYVIVEKTHALVKFRQADVTVIYLKSFLKNHIKNSNGNFFMVKSNEVSNDEFERYLASLSKYCVVTDRRGNRATLSVNDPF